MHVHAPGADLPVLLQKIEHELLPGLQIISINPNDPVRLLAIPPSCRRLGCGNYAAVLHHPHHPDLVLKVYAPGRPGQIQEAQVHHRIGNHPASFHCWHVGDGYLVLKRLHGIDSRLPQLSRTAFR